MSEFRRTYRRESFFWPVILIGLGVLFLLDNLGLLAWDVWTMAIRMWPLLLVAAGLDILFGRRAGIWPMLSVSLMVAIFAGAVWLMQSTSTFFEGGWREETINQPMEGAQEARIEIKLGAGELILSKMNDDANLIRGTVDLHENENLDQGYRLVGSTGYFSLESSGKYSSSWDIQQGFFNSREWVLELTDSIPLDVRISTGAGQSRIDLRGLAVSDLDVETGVGETIVYLPGSGQFDVNVSGGVGAVKVFLPKSLEARIIINSGLGNTSVEGQFNRNGNVWTSENFSTAEDGVEIVLNGGVGSIEVIQIELE